MVNRKPAHGEGSVGGAASLDERADGGGGALPRREAQGRGAGGLGGVDERRAQGGHLRQHQAVVTCDK